MQTPLWISGMHGLGDNIFQRSVLRELVKTREVYLGTPWPQIYKGINVRCVKVQTTLRTQAKNVDRSTAWHTLPGLVDARRWHYAQRGGTMLEALCTDIGIHPAVIDFSGPAMPKSDRAPYVVVRPVTRRTEWRSEAREPKAEYIAQAIEALRARYRIVSVADLAPPQEVAVEPLPYADETYHRGELHVEQLLALIANASALVGGVGFLAVAALAYQVPMLLIFGGWGMHNGPARIFDPRLDTSRIHSVMPDRFCMCGRADHACDKTISSLGEHIERFMLRLVAAKPASVAA